ncbi:lipocalin-like domain-containing protein [Spirosoma jeollabukense]
MKSHYAAKSFACILLVTLLLTGCSKKDSTPTPTVDVTGKWEMVAFVVDPPLADGTRDYLAYLRQLFSYNCSDITFYYTFNNDQTFSETDESKCMSGNTTDELVTGKWAVSGTKLTLTSDDGTTQAINMDYQPGGTGQYTQLILTWTNAGQNFTVTLNKV